MGDGWHLGIFGRIFSAFRARASGPSTIACQVGGGVVCARQEGWRYHQRASKEFSWLLQSTSHAQIGIIFTTTPEHGRGREWINISDFGTSQGC